MPYCTGNFRFKRMQLQDNTETLCINNEFLLELYTKCSTFPSSHQSTITMQCIINNVIKKYRGTQRAETKPEYNHPPAP